MFATALKYKSSGYAKHLEGKANLEIKEEIEVIDFYKSPNVVIPKNRSKIQMIILKTILCTLASFVIYHFLWILKPIIIIFTVESLILAGLKFWLNSVLCETSYILKSFIIKFDKLGSLKEFKSLLKVFLPKFDSILSGKLISKNIKSAKSLENIINILTLKTQAHIFSGFSNFFKVLKVMYLLKELEILLIENFFVLNLHSTKIMVKPEDHNIQKKCIKRSVLELLNIMRKGGADFDSNLSWLSMQLQTLMPKSRNENPSAINFSQITEDIKSLQTSTFVVENIEIDSKADLSNLFFIIEGKGENPPSTYKQPFINLPSPSPLNQHILLELQAKFNHQNQ